MMGFTVNTTAAELTTPHLAARVQDNAAPNPRPAQPVVRVEQHRVAAPHPAPAHGQHLVRQPAAQVVAAPQRVPACSSNREWWEHNAHVMTGTRG